MLDVLIYEVAFISDDDKRFNQIVFKFQFTFEEWDKPYSFLNYCNSLHQVTQDVGMRDIKWEVEDEESLSNGFRFYCVPASLESTIGDEVDRYVQIINEIQKEVEQKLSVRVHANSVVTHFNFPEPVRVACEQYLLYFIQFLKDVGVDATAELRHDAGEVLFTVTPVDENDALEKIRVALDTYLQIPSSPIINSSTAYGSSIEVQRLSANILHLQSQISLAQAILQAKDATIQQQQLTIEHQNLLLSADLVYDSRVNEREKGSSKDTDDKEEFLGGMVAITPVKGEGYEINLPEIIRKLRQLFGRESD